MQIRTLMWHSLTSRDTQTHQGDYSVPKLCLRGSHSTRCKMDHWIFDWHFRRKHYDSLSAKHAEKAVIPIIPLKNKDSKQTDTLLTQVFQEFTKHLEHRNVCAQCCASKGSPRRRCRLDSLLRTGTTAMVQRYLTGRCLVTRPGTTIPECVFWFHH